MFSFCLSTCGRRVSILHPSEIVFDHHDDQEVLVRAQDVVAVEHDLATMC